VYLDLPEGAINLITALYPGTFDPITNGHLDIANRASKLFDQLIIGVYREPAKSVLFNTEERVDLFVESVRHLPNVKVMPYDGLTVTFADAIDAKVVVRGLRMGSDFEREFEMALMNKKIRPGMELVCLMASLEFQFLSSTLLKEVSQLEGDINYLVPDHVAKSLRKKLMEQSG